MESAHRSRGEWLLRCGANSRCGHALTFESGRTGRSPTPCLAPPATHRATVTRRINPPPLSSRWATNVTDQPVATRPATRLSSCVSGKPCTAPRCVGRIRRRPPRGEASDAGRTFGNRRGGHCDCPTNGPTCISTTSPANPCCQCRYCACTVRAAGGALSRRRSFSGCRSSAMKPSSQGFASHYRRHQPPARGLAQVAQVRRHAGLQLVQRWGVEAVLGDLRVAATSARSLRRSASRNWPSTRLRTSR